MNPILRYECGRCGTIHSSRKEAEGCCPTPIDTVYQCSECDSAYYDEVWAEKCCTRTKMNNSDRDPDAYDRIREDAIMTEAADKMSENYQIRIEAAPAAWIASEIAAEAAARIASLEAQLIAVSGIAKRLHRAAKIRTTETWTPWIAEQYTQIADDLDTALAGEPLRWRATDMEKIASLEAQLAAAGERERRINQRAEILFDGIQGAHDMVTRWLAEPDAPATEKLVELAGMLETRMDMTGQPAAAALAAAQPKEGK